MNPIARAMIKIWARLVLPYIIAITIIFYTMSAIVQGIPLPMYTIWNIIVTNVFMIAIMACIYKMASNFGKIGLKQIGYNLGYADEEARRWLDTTDADDFSKEIREYARSTYASARKFMIGLIVVLITISFVSSAFNLAKVPAENASLAIISEMISICCSIFMQIMVFKAFCIPAIKASVSRDVVKKTRERVSRE